MIIAITRADGGVSIMHTVGNADPDAEVHKWKMSNSGYVSHREISGAPVIDRTFRNALKPDLSIDMPKAAEIYKEVLREKRKPFLEALDLKYQRALEQKDQKAIAQILLQKETLRDITDDPRIAKAQTTDDLLAIELPAVDSVKGLNE